MRSVALSIAPVSSLCLISLLSLASGCQSQATKAGEAPVATNAAASTPAPAAKSELSSEAIKADHVVVRANGLSCPLCANNLDASFKKLPGVASVDVDLGKGEIHLGLVGKQRPSPRSLAKAVTDSGFTFVSVK